MTGKRTKKPWGYEDLWAETDKYVGKLIHIKQGESLSLQYHNIKEETIRVVRRGEDGQRPGTRCSGADRRQGTPMVDVCRLWRHRRRGGRH